LSAPVPAADAAPEARVVERILDRDTGELLDLSAGALCAQCAGIGYTCCQPEYGVTITFHDARRLIDAVLATKKKFKDVNSLLAAIYDQSHERSA